MELIEFKRHIESLSSETKFKFGISSPFSWRGSYDEVAFSITEDPMSRDEVLGKISEAYTQDFYGYKGGKYKYGDYTTVNFERDNSSYTDGKYCGEMIAEIEGAPKYESQEERLIKVAFPSEK